MYYVKLLFTLERTENSLNTEILKMLMVPSINVHRFKVCCKEISIRHEHLYLLVVSLLAVRSTELTGPVIIKQFSMNCKVQLP